LFRNNRTKDSTHSSPNIQLVPKKAGKIDPYAVTELKPTPSAR